MSNTVQCQVEGLKAIYAYDPEGIIEECPAAFFEFGSIEEAEAASNEIRKFSFALDFEIDKRIPSETKFEVILGYSARERGMFGTPLKAHELIKRVVQAMGTLQETKEVPVVKVKYRQLKFPYGKFKLDF